MSCYNVDAQCAALYNLNGLCVLSQYRCTKCAALLTNLESVCLVTM
jgi:hypothetical protein